MYFIIDCNFYTSTYNVQELYYEKKTINPNNEIPS